MSNHIDKDSAKRWFYVQTNSTGEDSLICFGNAGEQFISVVDSGEFLLNDYLTENELQIEVNNIAGSNDYFKTSVETNNGKFLYPSGLYEEIPPPTPPEPIPPDSEES